MQVKPLRTIVFQDKKLWINGVEITGDVFIDFSNGQQSDIKIEESEAVIRQDIKNIIRDAEFTEVPPVLGINVADKVEAKSVFGPRP